MNLADLIVEVRDVNLVRRGQIAHRFLDLRADLVDLAVSSWTLRLPAEHPMATVLRQEGSGLIVTHRDPAVGVLWSGPRDVPTDAADKTDPTGILTVTGVDDNTLLWRRRAYPSPAVADVAAQTVSHDVRTGNAETVLRAYVDANLGPSAPVGRRVDLLTLAANQGRGPSVTRSARFDVLGDLLADIARATGLRFRVVQIGAALQFQVLPTRDRSRAIRLDVRNGTLTSHSVGGTPARATRVIVAGQGDGADRVFLERADAAAETAWGPFGRVEVFQDQRQASDPAELIQAGDKTLLEAAAVGSVKAIPSDDQSMRWPQHWDRGDLVTVVVAGQETQATVSAIQLVVNRDGVKVGAGIGDVRGWTPTSAVERQMEATVARVSSLERNVAAPLHGALPVGANLNDYLDPGVYSANTNAVGVTLLNAPVGGALAGNLEVTRTQDGRGVFQTFRTYTGQVFTRSYHNGAWTSAWEMTGMGLAHGVKRGSFGFNTGTLYDTGTILSQAYPAVAYPTLVRWTLNGHCGYPPNPTTIRTDSILQGGGTKYADAYPQDMAVPATNWISLAEAGGIVIPGSTAVTLLLQARVTGGQYAYWRGVLNWDRTWHPS